MWGEATELVASLPSQQLRSDVVIHSAAVSACGEAERWRQAMDLFAMREFLNVSTALTVAVLCAATLLLSEAPAFTAGVTGHGAPQHGPGRISSAKATFASAHEALGTHGVLCFGMGFGALVAVGRGLAARRAQGSDIAVKETADISKIAYLQDTTRLNSEKELQEIEEYEKLMMSGKVPFAVPGPSGYFFTGFVTQWKGKEPFAGDQVITLTESGLFAKQFLSALAFYREGLKPWQRGLEIGMAHGDLAPPTRKLREPSYNSLVKSMLGRMHPVSGLHGELLGKRVGPVGTRAEHLGLKGNTPEALHVSGFRVFSLMGAYTTGPSVLGLCLNLRAWTPQCKMREAHASSREHRLFITALADFERLPRSDCFAAALSLALFPLGTQCRLEQDWLVSTCIGGLIFGSTIKPTRFDKDGDKPGAGFIEMINWHAVGGLGGAGFAHALITASCLHDAEQILRMVRIEMQQAETSFFLKGKDNADKAWHLSRDDSQARRSRDHPVPCTGSKRAAPVPSQFAEDGSAQTAAISACAEVGQWQRAAQLQWRGPKEPGDVAIFGATLFAAAASWPQALTIQVSLQDAGLQGNAITLNSLAQAFQLGMQWQRAVMLQECWVTSEGDPLAYSTLFQACALAAAWPPMPALGSRLRHSLLLALRPCEPAAK
ncbi:psaL [Symbiodinium necroappetens]|uniref:PsaL protein n=1 Tax=Symbiodinium necroappetens TaxID=1628268 RepID=A0A812LAJ5_9DINO|nr:psaL [Symbiodinium necroappetens]